MLREELDQGQELVESYPPPQGYTESGEPGRRPYQNFMENKFMRALTRTIGFIKVPFPALEINSNQSTFHWLYF